MTRSNLADFFGLRVAGKFCSFAYVEMSLMLAKIFYQYDLELVDKDLNWEGQSHMHVMWWKPALHVRFHERK